MVPYLIGLTGGIGSGKSTVAAEFENLGAEIVVGDELGKRVLEESTQLIARIRDRFGDSVFNEDGSLNRRSLGQALFASPEDVRWLTDLTFPGIYKLWRDAVRLSQKSVMVFDAALIFEWGIEQDFDLVLLVTSDVEEIRQRMKESGRLSESELDARLAAQMPLNDKIAKADLIIGNDGTIEDLRQFVRNLWREKIEPESVKWRKERNDSSL